MATQPIAPSDTKARIARLKSRTLLSQPKKGTLDKTILVHRCFSQIKGEIKPANCGCRERVSYSDALAMVAKAEASWLLIRNPKSTDLVKSKRAIVAETFHERAEEQAQQRTELKARLEVQAAVPGKFRKFVLREFSKGNLSQAIVNISDMELRAYLGNPEHLRDRFPEFAEKRFWEKVVEFSSEFWANHTDEPTETGPYLTGAPKGQGQIVYKKPSTLEKIAGYDREAASEAETLNLVSERVQAANFVPREFNGGFISSGHGPDAFEHSEDD